MSNKPIATPCPFCGTKVDPTESHRDSASAWAVHCTGCGGRGPKAHLPDENPSELPMHVLDEICRLAAIRKWNNRA